MPPWAWGIITGITVGVVMLILNKLTTKSSAQMASDLKSVQEDVERIKTDGWTTDDKVKLAERLTRIESQLGNIRTDVDFTKTSHQEFLRLLEKALIPVAHSPHTPELDRLLEKRDRGEELTSQEWQEMLDRLDQEAKTYKDAEGKKVALLGLRAIYLTHLRAAQKLEQRRSGQHARSHG